eukprot:scaffold31256_cov63-Phaeocystis_antarctica.AAC.1
MMKDELDLPMPDEADHANSVHGALTMFASFSVFGMVSSCDPDPYPNPDPDPDPDSATLTLTAISTPIYPDPDPDPHHRCPSSASPSCHSCGGTARTRSSSYSHYFLHPTPY